MSLLLSWILSLSTVLEQITMISLYFKSTDVFHNDTEKKKMTGFQGTRWKNLSVMTPIM